MVKTFFLIFTDLHLSIFNYFEIEESRAFGNYLFLYQIPQSII